MNKRKFSLLFAIIVVLLLSACMTKAPKPYFTDRTNGWEPSFDFEGFADGGTLQETDYAPVFYCFLFHGSHLTYEVALPDFDMEPERIMEYGLKLAFGDRYIDIGEEEISIIDHVRNGLRIYAAGSTRVFFDTKHIAILQCIDARLQPQFAGTKSTETKGVFSYHIDFAQLTVEEIQICKQYLVPTMYVVTHRLKQTDLPLTQEKAYQVSVNDIYNRYGDEPGAIGGGEYKMYDCEKSNSWLICGERFTQMLDKDTGECILLTWAVTDLSVTQRDG